MNTPICDFIRDYAASGILRLHMPGHKGMGPLGCEAFDITEVSGADDLSAPEGVIAESEENATALFGSRHTFYSTEGSSQCIKAMLYLALLLHYVSRQAAAGQNAAQPRNETIEKICSYLSANYSQKLDLGSVAARFYLSPYYLSRLFRRVTGQSIVDFINARRIEAARRLLETSDLGINDVAEATGFSTTAHFRRVFREHVGVSPMQYRKARRGG